MSPIAESNKMDKRRLLEIVARIEADMARLEQAVTATQRTLKALAVELKQNGEKVETLQAGQRLLAGQFKARDGHGYGIGRQISPREVDE
jgi:phage-related minor tail protein